MLNNRSILVFILEASNKVTITYLLKNYVQKYTILTCIINLDTIINPNVF
jgi:hypothetical protein